ncbi:MAG: ABC transporter permease [Anaerolineae bacterium]|nr:ABC transporter permease [Anaerolineae bacterium]
MDEVLINQIAGIVRSGAPLILAAVGETFTERVGVVNLSLNGSLMLAGLAGFVIGVSTQSHILGMVAAMAVGMVVALIVAASSIELKQSQVAVGFVLTLLCRDLAIFLGETWRNTKGLPTPNVTIPLLSQIPIIGEIFFQQDIFTYLSFIVVIAAAFWIFRTRAGLALRSIGERPETSFARGFKVNRTRYMYTALGGALVGLAGAAYTLNIFGTWAESNVDGQGWIALAIVIFGGWYPSRVALGVYLVAALRAFVNAQQTNASQSTLQLLLLLPWLLMVVALVLVSNKYLERLLPYIPMWLHPPIRALLRARPPAALGTTFDQEGRR